jgi:hypothetical protein
VTLQRWVLLVAIVATALAVAYVIWVEVQLHAAVDREIHRAGFTFLEDRERE